MLRPISADIGLFAITGFRFLFCFFVLSFVCRTNPQYSAAR
jgi:hypothetical protein